MSELLELLSQQFNEELLFFDELSFELLNE